MINPSDLLKFDNCLFIPDNMSPRIRPIRSSLDADHCVWKIPLSDPDHPEKMLTSLGKWSPWSLSKTLNSNEIIITTMTEQTPQKAYFWSPSTGSVQIVMLPPNVHNPRHIIELSSGLSSGSYLLCHCPESGQQLKKVCRLVCNGNEMNFVGSPSGLDDIEPEHLAKLPDGRVLVVDHFNNRLLVLDADLKIHMVLMRPKKGGKKRPCRFAYDSSSGFLLVAFHHYAGLYYLPLS